MASPAPIHPDLLALFIHAKRDLKAEDVRENVPGDPSSGASFKLWNSILRTGKIPDKVTFDLSEVIGLVGWSDVENARRPESFKAFRRFTSSVGLVFLERGLTDGGCLPAPHFFTLNLLRDLGPGDQETLNYLRRAFAACSQFLKDQKGCV
jgi:hypothetical protein